MKYDFENYRSRKNKGSFKWDAMYQINPNLPDHVVPLSVADMEFQTAPEIRDGLCDYIQDNVLGYTKPTRKYYEAVIHWMERRHQYQIQKEWIVNTSGVVPAIYNAVRTLTQPEEGIIILTPVYYPFYAAVELQKRNIVCCELREDDGYYTINFEQLEALAQEPRNKMLIFCSPHNPVGRVWTEVELRQVAEICIKNNLLLVSDEIHHDLIMPGHHHTVMQNVSRELEDIIITCTAASKTFNLAGLQVSNIIIPNTSLRQRFEEGLRVIGPSVGALGILGTQLAYDCAENWLDELIQVIDGHQKWVHEEFLKECPSVKARKIEGTYLQWIDFRSLGLGKAELEHLMQKEAFAFLDEGYIFGEGGVGFERINLAAPRKVIEETVHRMIRSVTNLK